MRINQVASQLKAPSATINEAIAQLHQNGNGLFPSDRYETLTEPQIAAIRDHLTAPQQPQQRSQSQGAPRGGSARSVGGAFGVVNQQINQSAAVAGVQSAREAVQTMKTTAMHLLLNCSPDEIDDLALSELGLETIEDGGAANLMGELLGGLGKHRGPILEFSPQNPMIAGTVNPALKSLSAASESVTEPVGEPSSPSA